MIPAHQVVERALAAAVADETIVLVTDTATAATKACPIRRPADT